MIKEELSDVFATCCGVACVCVCVCFGYKMFTCTLFFPFFLINFHSCFAGHIILFSFLIFVDVIFDVIGRAVNGLIGAENNPPLDKER